MQCVSWDKQRVDTGSVWATFPVLKDMGEHVMVLLHWMLLVHVSPFGDLRLSNAL